MRTVLLGAPRPLHLNRWKDDLAEAGGSLGWDVTHVPARDVPTDEVVKLCRGADLLIWARTHGHNPSGDVRRMLCEVEDAGTATAAVHLDLYWGLGRREAEIGVGPWWSCQFVFTADGGHQNEFRGRGVNHHWMPPPVGKRWLGPYKPDRARFGRTDAVFVGSNVPGIHGKHREELLRWASVRYGQGFRRVGGSNGLWGSDLGTLYATAGVAVGDSADSPRYWSDRVPCTLGRGGLLAYPRTDGLDEQGITGAVAVLYDRFDFDSIADQVGSMTAGQRADMRSAAIDLTANKHLWEHRLLQIQEAVFECA